MFKKLFKRRGAKANKPRERPNEPLECYFLLADGARLLIQRLEERPFDEKLYFTTVRLPFDQIETLLERVDRLVYLHSTNRPFSFNDTSFEPVTKLMERWLEGKTNHYLPIQETFLTIAKIALRFADVMKEVNRHNDSHNNARTAFDLAWEFYLDIVNLSNL